MNDRYLKILRKVCLKVASAETSCWPEAYKKTKKKSPLFLHCTAVATVVQAVCGGNIVSGIVKGNSHYWNRLPDGQEVDLTSCQFGGDGFTPFKKGRRVRDRKLTNVRFLLFAQKVLEQLENAI